MVMKRLLQIIAVALIVFGVMWSLQGLGILMWPAGSFMLAQREWGLYGALIAAIGALLLALTRRMGPRP